MSLRERVKPYLSQNGAVKYITTTDPVKREKIVRDHKFPDPEGDAQANYYRPALEGIENYHYSDNNPAIIAEATARLVRYQGGGSDQKIIKLENNLRVLRAYIPCFGTRKLTPIQSEPFTTTIEGVDIRLRPDLIAREGKRTRLIRFNLRKESPSKEEAQASAQLLYKYGKLTGLEIGPADCLLFSVSDGAAISMAGSSVKFENQFRAFMREYKRCWNDLQMPRSSN